MGSDTRRSIALVDPNVYIDKPARPRHRRVSFSAFPSSAMLLRPIDALLPRASRNYGTKARNLAALVRAGFPVPMAYALPCEAAALTFSRVLPRALQPAQLFSRAFVPERDLLEARERVLGAQLHSELERDLRRVFAALRAATAESVAVRSSSAVEDLSAASAAGLNASVLGVSTEAALLDAVRRCLAAVFTPRVAQYLGSLGEEVGSIGIVLQAMVPADVAGVLFTLNPLTGDRDEIVIDATYGLGTSVTEGRATPDTYRIHKASGWVRDRVLGDKQTRVVVSADGVLEEQVVPPALSQKQALDEHMLAQLVALGQRVEEHFGDARDIEFAIAKDSIYVLQARPITAGRQPAGNGRGRRKKRLGDDATTLVWSNLNVGEALPGVATPLTWSVLSQFSEVGFREAFAVLGCKVPKDATLVGNFRGRIYLNLTELSQIAGQVPGLRPSLWLPFGGGSEIEQLSREARSVSSRGFLLRLPRTAARFTRSSLGLRRNVEAFEAAFEAERARIEGLDFRILSASALDETLSDVHRLLSEAGTLLLTAYGALLAALVPLRTALALLKGDQADSVQHALLAALEDIESAGPGREILRMASVFTGDPAARSALLTASPKLGAHALPPGAARDAVEAFLTRYGHRGVREAEIAAPRWREDPTLLFEAIRVQLAHGQPDAASRMQQRIDAVRGSADAELASLPLPTRAPLRALLSVARNQLRLRERMRAHVVRVLGLFRLLALDASRRLLVREPDVNAGAAFFLTLDELHGVLRGDLRTTAGLVRLRRAQYERDRVLPDPPDTFVGYPPPIQPAVVTGEFLRGLGASTGAAEGTVRVLRSSEDVTSLVPGEILVVPSADVGWSPLFVVAAGLVTDVGGPLSHACVVAREYGLPAVVNVRSATRSLKTGERVRVDGGAGTVQRLP
jgi:phosphohistidine swiveling domain-containing protein